MQKHTETTKPRNKILHDLSIKLVKFINLIMMTVPFAVAWYRCYASLLWVQFAMRGHWLVIALFMFLYYTIGRIYDAFKISYNRRRDMVYSQALSLIEADVVMYVVAWLLIRHVPAILPMIFVYVIQLLIAVAWSTVAKSWYYHTFPAERTVVVWDMRQGIPQLIKEYKLSKKYKVIDTVSVTDCVNNLAVLDGADTVFLVGVHSHDRNVITKYCLLNEIKAFLIPRTGDLIIAGAKRSHMFHFLMLKVERYNPSIEYLFFKRLGDIILSLVALVVFSPIILLTSICIKMEDGGPVFYKQCRLTKDGKRFNIFKFRSMRTDAEKDGVARLSTGEHDDRITRVGQFIRKVRIDEIPQLLNILKGDISIVGPRAERPELAEEYQKELPEFELRLQVKAGLTGYAQVYGKYNTIPYDKLIMDLMYIANASIFEDLRIIFATVKILFMPESTEGIEEGATNAMDGGKQ